MSYKFFAVLVIVTLTGCAGFSGPARDTSANLTEAQLRYARIDAHSLSVSGRRTLDVEALAQALIRPARTEEEKVRAIFRWMADNISYDVESLLDGSYKFRRIDAADVLRERKAVCDGYTRLFLALAEAAGLTAQTVSGYTKLSGIRDENKHAWSAVKINGRWHLLDTTWAAGVVDENNRFQKRFDDFYFLTSPTELIATHYPESREWQLLPEPISYQSFVNTPDVWSEFHRSGLALKSHRQRTIRADSSVKVMLDVAEGTLLTARLDRYGDALPRNHAQVILRGTVAQVRAVFPEQGVYQLLIFAKRDPESTLYHSALRYDVVAAAGSDEKLAVIGPAFTEHAWSEPVVPRRARNLRPGSEIHLHARVEPGMHVSAQIRDLGRDTLIQNGVLVERSADGHTKFVIPWTNAPVGELRLEVFSGESDDLPGRFAFSLDLGRPWQLAVPSDRRGDVQITSTALAAAGIGLGVFQETRHIAVNP